DYAQRKGGQEQLIEQMNTKYYYFTRTKGLFRICYPKERPNTDFSDDALSRLHMGRSVIVIFIVAFFVIFIAFWTGVAGCWRRSPGNITATAILMLLACLLSAGAMGFWHGVEYYERERVVGEEFYQQWSNVSNRQPYWVSGLESSRMHF
ncbi:uncharacterized protein LOC103521091, partial [Diaphorina citri]|uniref:Uncharacterized protein LOC103521091 n=1 Tax=Diaphorina citri TaxID=121845 RepID=A0A1S3DMB6_DIACI